MNERFLRIFSQSALKMYSKMYRVDFMNVMVGSPVSGDPISPNITYLEWQAKWTQPHRSFHHGTDQIFNVCCCYFTGISLNDIKRANLICCCCLWPKQMAASQYLWSLLGGWTIEGSGLLNSRVWLKNTRFATSRKRKRAFKKYRRKHLKECLVPHIFDWFVLFLLVWTDYFTIVI